MKRKSNAKKTPNKKVKEDKTQRSLEFYFNKQNKATNDISKKSEKNSINEENNSIYIEQNQTNNLNDVSKDNLSIELITDNVNVKESSAIIENPATSIISDTSENSKKIRSTAAVNITSDCTIQSSCVEKNVMPSSSSEMSIDMDILEFDPSKVNWDGLKTPYRFLSDTFAIVEKTTSRLKIIDCLTNMFRTIIYHDPESVLPAVWLSSNAIAPSYEGVELGIGSQILSKAIKSVYGTSSNKLKQYYDKYGDWGDVAYAAKVSVRTLIEPKPLTVDKLYSTFISVSKLKGSGVTDQKTDLVKKLLISCKGEEVRYLTRTLVQNLRIGAVRTTCLIALARAFCLTRPTNMVISESLDGKDRLFVEVIDKESRDSLNIKLKAAEKLLKECYSQFHISGFVHPSGYFEFYYIKIT